MRVFKFPLSFALSKILFKKKGHYLSALVLLSVAVVAFASPFHDDSKCRLLPGGPQWPSVSDWSKLNSGVEDRLIATVPLASVCHDPTYIEAECLALQESWPFSQTQYVFLCIVTLHTSNGESIPLILATKFNRN